MLRLAEQVGGDGRGVGAVVGDHHQLARAGGKVDAGAAGGGGDQRFRGGDPGVAGAADAVDGLDLARAEGQRGDRLRPADRPDRVDLRLWDTGVRLYALPYYAHTQTITQQPEMLARFLRATARGWAFSNKNRDQAVDMLIKEYPNLNLADERLAIDSLMSYAYNAQTNANGWGAMDRNVWQEQIQQYADLGQFTKRVPKVDEVMTMDILNATREYRLRNS